MHQSGMVAAVTKMSSSGRKKSNYSSIRNCSSTRMTASGTSTRGMMTMVSSVCWSGTSSSTSLSWLCVATTHQTTSQLSMTRNGTPREGLWSKNRKRFYRIPSNSSSRKKWVQAHKLSQWRQSWVKWIRGCIKTRQLPTYSIEAKLA